MLPSHRHELHSHLRWSSLQVCHKTHYIIFFRFFFSLAFYITRNFSHLKNSRLFQIFGWKWSLLDAVISSSLLYWSISCYLLPQLILHTRCSCMGFYCCAKEIYMYNQLHVTQFNHILDYSWSEMIETLNTTMPNQSKRLTSN